MLTELDIGANDQELSGKGHASKVVQSLMKDKLPVNHGYSLYMDNFNNSVALAKILGKIFNEGVRVGKWRDKRPVLYISTEYDNKFAVIQNRRGQEVSKPEVIVQYNKFMSGVDHQDQMLAYYPCGRKTIPWYKKLFVHVLQLHLVYSHKPYQRYASGTKIPFYDFRLSIIDELLPAQTSKPKRPLSCIQHRISVLSERVQLEVNQRVKRKR
nr:unnamed protein product [Callosobruchus analis]